MSSSFLKKKAFLFLIKINICFCFFLRSNDKEQVAEMSSGNPRIIQGNTRVGKTMSSKQKKQTQERNNNNNSATVGGEGNTRWIIGEKKLALVFFPENEGHYYPRRLTDGMAGRTNKRTMYMCVVFMILSVFGGFASSPTLLH